MATATPPRPPASPSPSEPGRRRTARSSRAGVIRLFAVGALVLVVLVVAYLVFAGGGGASYKLEFAEADQLVRGDQVQVGGVPVGSITGIELTKRFTAVVTIHVDSALAPLHAGTVAVVRVPSLSSVANRYVALSPGPNNARALPSGTKLPASATSEVTDLDKLFDTLNPKTRKGLQQFIVGSAEQYVGQGRTFGPTVEYFGPSISATDHLLAELIRDQGTFTSFLVETAKAVSTIGARKEQLSSLIENANTTFTAVGSEQSSLARGLKELPVALRQGNRTFAALPSTFKALKALVDASKPTSKPLTELFTKLRPLVSTATPVVGNFSQAFSKPGANNDLTDFVRALPALASRLASATPPAISADRQSIPVTAFFGPYSPDLEGTLREFGQTAAYYDANGHYARISPVFPDFTLGTKNTLTPTSAAQALAPLKTGQLRRCPGSATQPAADGSSPFADSGQLSCDPTETP